MKSEILNSLLANLIFFALIAFFYQQPSRYQVANCDIDRAIVLDEYSGEAWITDKYSKTSVLLNTETVFYLKPLGYCENQNDSYTYKPDEKRSDKNLDFASWAKRKLKKVFFKPNK